jgi:hypothetical protein
MRQTTSGDRQPDSEHNNHGDDLISLEGIAYYGEALVGSEVTKYSNK